MKHLYHHREQRVSSYVSGHGLTVYETEQYNQYNGEWYIVGDSTTNKELIESMVELHNLRLKQSNPGLSLS